MNFLKKYFLLFTVFVTGAAVLIIEVLAIRILAPYFGTTIYSVSSVLTVILGALSAGYYFGGRLADRYPSERIFYGLVFAGGASVLLLRLTALFILPFLGLVFPLTSGPLVSSLILFFLPSFLLGLLSPFAIKLQHLAFVAEGIGSITGSVFFWSTFGSIIGSLLAGFVLIPYFGVNRIIIATGVLLSILGLLPLLKTGFPKKKIAKMLLLFALIFIPSFFLNSNDFLPGKIIYEKDGVYGKTIIFDGRYKERPVRFLFHDKSYDSAMFLDSDELVFDYTKYFSLYKIFTPLMKEALILGGGAYSIPKALLNESSEVNVDVVDVAPDLWELGKKYFKTRETARLKNYVEDGRRFLQDSGKKYDLIFQDVNSSIMSIPFHFTTQEFFQLVQSKLNDDGIFLINVIGTLSRRSPNFLFSEIKTFQSIFPNSYFFAVESPKILGLQNFIFVGQKSNTNILASDVNILASDVNILFKDKLLDLKRFDLIAPDVLTDDFAPVDYLVSKFFIPSFETLFFNPNGEEMMALVAQQLNYGPRFLSAPGHKKTQDFLKAEMEALADDVKIQKWRQRSSSGSENELVNIIGGFYLENKKRIILATHYDSRKFADLDRYSSSSPMPGANDSASGVAVLVETARYLANAIPPQVGVDIAFFDAEEGEDRIKPGFDPGWKPLGSTYFSENIKEIYQEDKPIGGLVVDMVCDKNLALKPDESSLIFAPHQTKMFWDLAADFNPVVFKKDKISAIIDDHFPLNQAGIPTFLIIDFDYPPFHTVEDTLDKCAPQSMEIAAQAVLKYIYTLK